MGKLKWIENILKAASTLAAALMSFVKFIGMAFSMKTETAQPYWTEACKKANTLHVMKERQSENEILMVD